MIKYFLARDALTCLRVSKELKNLLSEKELERLRIRVVKQVAYEKQIEWLDCSLKQCEMCGEELSKGRMTRHLEKHQQTLKAGGKIQRVKPAWEILEYCKRCNAPFPGYGPHKTKGCPLEVIYHNYLNHNFTEIYPWAERVSNFSGYRIKLRSNKAFKCKNCNELFSPYTKNEQAAFDDHLKECKY